MKIESKKRASKTEPESMIKSEFGIFEKNDALRTWHLVLLKKNRTWWKKKLKDLKNSFGLLSILSRFRVYHIIKR